MNLRCGQDSINELGKHEHHNIVLDSSHCKCEFMFEDTTIKQEEVYELHNPHLTNVLFVLKLNLTLLVGKGDTEIGSGQESDSK